MTRVLLVAALVAPLAGCTGAHTITGMFGGNALPKDGAAADALAAGPARPTPPAVLITPGEVAPDNATAAAAKLTSELEHDLKNTPPAPKTPIVSRYKNGEKVE